MIENLENIRESVDEYPEFIARGSLLQVDFTYVNGFNEEQNVIEVLYLVQVDVEDFMLISFTTGNRWLSVKIKGNKTGVVHAKSIITALNNSIIKSNSTCKSLKGVRVISHSSRIDAFE